MDGTFFLPMSGVMRWNQTRKGTMRFSMPCMIMPAQPQMASQPSRSGKRSSSVNNVAVASGTSVSAITRPARQ